MSSIKEKADNWLANNNGLTTLILIGAVITPIIWLFSTEEQTPKTAPVTAESKKSVAVSGVASKEAKELAALMLNLNKLLCAEVVEIRPLKVQQNIHEVTCIEYRGGSGKKTYLIDIEKGTAWIP